MGSQPSPNAASHNGPTDPTSPSLLARVIDLRPEAWRRLVKLYGPMIYVWARQAGLQPEDAADVVQEVFVSVATHIGTFDQEQPGSTFRGWLWTIAQNKVRDHFRRQRGKPQAQGGTDAQVRLAQLPDQLSDSSLDTPSPARVWIDPAVLDAIRAEFEERTWTAFTRSAIDGQSSAEIAAELGMTKRAVRQAKYRVLRRLRQEFEGLLE